MSKKDICLTHQTIGYFSGLNGLEFRYIEDGINSYAYCIAGEWNGKKSYHKLKIYTDKKGDFYVKLNGYKIPFNECIRTNVF